MLATSITRMLGLDHPILLAPMDVVADANLVQSVSAAGGLGLLGGGYGNEAWLKRELALLRGANARFGVGFITWSLARQPQLLDLTLHHGPVAVMLSFGDPAPFADRVKRNGVRLICQVQSVAMAREAVAAGADVIVAQGGEAGGHGVSRGVMALVPEIVDAIGTEVPVIAAGGIADGRGMAAALMLGASGVLLGTRFYASQEAAGHATAKERIREATGDDSVRSIVFDISRRNVWPSPFTGRCLRNGHVDRWLGREIELLRTQDSESSRYGAAREIGDFDVAAVIAGEASGLCRDIAPAGAIVTRIAAQAEELLTRASIMSRPQRAGAVSLTPAHT